MTGPSGLHTFPGLMLGGINRINILRHFSDASGP